MNKDSNSDGKGVARSTLTAVDDDDSITKKPKRKRKTRSNQMRKHYAKKREFQNNLHLSMKKEIESSYDHKKNMTPTLLMELSLKEYERFKINCIEVGKC